MGKETIRDEVWTLTLIYVVRKETAVRASDIADKAGCSERTAQNTMNAIARAKFIKKEAMDDGSVRYVPSGDLKSTA